MRELDKKINDSYCLEGIIIRLLVEKVPNLDRIVEKKKIKMMEKKLLPYLRSAVGRVYDFKKKKMREGVIGKKITRELVEEIIYKVTGFEEFGPDQEMKALTASKTRTAGSEHNRIVVDEQMKYDL